jgi:hypothetical protein
VEELVPGRKVVWLVEDSTLNWLTGHKHEWTGTRMVFELAPHGEGTALRFTHQGLVPSMECHARCAEGWDMVIKERLYRFVTEGKAFE